MQGKIFSKAYEETVYKTFIEIKMQNVRDQRI